MIKIKKKTKEIPERGSRTVKSGADKPQGTFIIKILNKQHSTWQGSVTWVEEQKTQNFRSALELLKMIDGALDEEADIEGGSHEV